MDLLVIIQTRTCLQYNAGKSCRKSTSTKGISEAMDLFFTKTTPFGTEQREIPGLRPLWGKFFVGVSGNECLHSFISATFLKLLSLCYCCHLFCCCCHFATAATCFAAAATLLLPLC